MYKLTLLLAFGLLSVTVIDSSHWAWADEEYLPGRLIVKFATFPDPDQTSRERTRLEGRLTSLGMIEKEPLFKEFIPVWNAWEEQPAIAESGTTSTSSEWYSFIQGTISTVQTPPPLTSEEIEQRREMAWVAMEEYHMQDIWMVTFSEGANMQALAEMLSGDPAVVYAHPDYFLHPDQSELPNDTYVDPNQNGSWLVTNDVWADEDMVALVWTKAHKAWEHWGTLQGTGVAGYTRAGLIPTGGGGYKPVVVAVIDTGVDYRHEDLGGKMDKPENCGNMWTNIFEGGDPRYTISRREDGVDNDHNGFKDDWIGWDFGDDDNNPMDDSPKNGHGTSSAGVISAVGNNSLGIIGAAPRTNVMALKVWNRKGEASSSNICKAIEYARDNGARIINMSLGSFHRYSKGKSDYRDAVGAAHLSGCVVVTSAGNETIDVGDETAGHCPSCIRKAIAVASCYPSGYITRKDSNHGLKIDVAAPGGRILTTRSSHDTESKVIGKYYTEYGGTSGAACFVSAAAALALSANDWLTPEQIRQALRTGAVYGNERTTWKGWDRAGHVNFYSGRGFLDAARTVAVAAALSSPLEVLLTDPIDPIVVRSNQPNGLLRIRGRARGPDFKSWMLYYVRYIPSDTISMLPDRASWVKIASSTTQTPNWRQPRKPQDVTLADWDVKAREPGIYYLILEARTTTTPNTLQDQKNSDPVTLYHDQMQIELK